MKEERIEKQYYVSEGEVRKKAEELMEMAEGFVVNIKLIKANLTNEVVKSLRKQFTKLTS